MTEAINEAARAKLEAIEAKYRDERAKRLRPDGNAQYKALSSLSADFDRDPYADPDFKRDAFVGETEVAIIGGGISGLLTAVRLKQSGIADVRIIDRAGDFGGTWYWSRYPGAACDVESYIYMPLLEETGYMPTEKYAKSPEIFAHCQRIAKQFDLYPKALFQTVVQDLRWIDAASRWEITTDRGDRVRARYVVTAGGILHKAKLPGIPGIETFKGKAFHTGRWDFNYTGGSSIDPLVKLADKRVAIIGTGATSVQIVPKLAASAKQLFVFQRTPTNVGERNNRPTDPEWVKTLKPGWHKERMENFTRITTGQGAGAEDLIKDGFTEIFGRNPNSFGVSTPEERLLDIEAMEAIRNRIDSIVTDKQTAEALKPWYNIMCKRPCFHDEYLQCFNQPNVKLVDTSGKGVERITEDSVVVDGVAYPVDCIIYASGYDVGATYTDRMGFDIHGRGGVSLGEAWVNGPGTLHGTTIRGFPNLFNIHTLQTGIGINFAHLLSELAIHVASIISTCVERKVVEMEPSEAAQEAWFHTLLANLGSQPQFFAECTPGYNNGEGAIPTDASAIRYIPYFGPMLDYVKILEDWRAAGNLEGLELRVNETAA